MALNVDCEQVVLGMKKYDVMWATEPGDRKTYLLKLDPVVGTAFLTFFGSTKVDAWEHLQWYAEENTLELKEPA